MAEVQLKRKITLRRKEKPAEFTFDGLLKVKLLWQSKTDLDLCIFFKRKDGQIGGVFSSAFRQKKSDLGNLSEFPFMLHKEMKQNRHLEENLQSKSILPV